MAEAFQHPEVDLNHKKEVWSGSDSKPVVDHSAPMVSCLGTVGGGGSISAPPPINPSRQAVGAGAFNNHMLHPSPPRLSALPQSFASPADPKHHVHPPAAQTPFHGAFSANISGVPQSIGLQPEYAPTSARPTSDYPSQLRQPEAFGHSATQADYAQQGNYYTHQLPRPAEPVQPSVSALPSSGLQGRPYSYDPARAAPGGPAYGSARGQELGVTSLFGNRSGETIIASEVSTLRKDIQQLLVNEDKMQREILVVFGDVKQLFDLLVNNIVPRLDLLEQRLVSLEQKEAFNRSQSVARPSPVQSVFSSNAPFKPEVRKAEYVHQVEEIKAYSSEKPASNVENNASNFDNNASNVENSAPGVESGDGQSGSLDLESHGGPSPAPIQHSPPPGIPTPSPALSSLAAGSGGAGGGGFGGYVVSVGGSGPPDPKKISRIYASVPNVDTSNPIAALINFCKHQLRFDLDFKSMEESDGTHIVELYLPDGNRISEARDRKKKTAKEEGAKKALVRFNEEPELLKKWIEWSLTRP